MAPLLLEDPAKRGGTLSFQVSTGSKGGTAMAGKSQRRPAALNDTYRDLYHQRTIVGTAKYIAPRVSPSNWGSGGDAPSTDPMSPKFLAPTSKKRSLLEPLAGSPGGSGTLGRSRSLTGLDVPLGGGACGAVSAFSFCFGSAANFDLSASPRNAGTTSPKATGARLRREHAPFEGLACRTDSVPSLGDLPPHEIREKRASAEVMKRCSSAPDLKSGDFVTGSRAGTDFEQRLSRRSSNDGVGGLGAVTPPAVKAPSAGEGNRVVRPNDRNKSAGAGVDQSYLNPSIPFSGFPSLTYLRGR